MKYMLDTNICIYTIKNRPEAVRARFVEYLGQMCVSSIVASELHYGAAKSGISRHLEDVNSLLARLAIRPFDEMCAERAGAIRALLNRQGKPIGPYDLLIAAHAMTLNLTLVTNNLREFERIPGLLLENWT